MKNLLQPENEVEANVIKSLLDENGINAEINSYHDTAYDGLYQAQYGWGVIRVAEEDFEKAKQIVEEWHNASPDEVPWEETQTIEKKQIKKSPITLRSSLFVISLLLNIFFIFSYFGIIGEPLDTYQPSKLYDKNGKLISAFRFSTNSEFPFEGTEYSVKGEILFKIFDANENGRFERFVDYYDNRKTTMLDANENGIYEISTENFNNGTVIKSYDKDENKVFELVEIIDKNNQIVATLFDNNQDTFEDEIHYIENSGEKRIFPITVYNEIANRIFD